MKTIKLSWGLQPPEGAVCAWGARAIFHPPAGIDLLWDRQGGAGDEKELDKLLKQLNGKGLKLLRAELKKQDLRTNSGEVVTVKFNGCVVKASPKRSYGYLYIGAWKDVD